ncbi:Enoyl-(Acyl carrier protein) reductase [Rhizoctonia solani]|uniref:2,4-dienoyl-CoA reductase [(3E)-enoyl-CoA-producing] n=1 Tax=Rhizoctonia solani TaxID=456999 RepID=A0A8H8NTL8_9AGAM|nr:Enoyl-(Acyl carrier protein) reductase [Rhizoctonia solani]QRW19801.1 Enoyl-(Acyl carrier protein) reductase [Rhizoctonia solani]
MTPTPSKTVYVANYIPSTSTFKDNIFDGKVLFCTGGGSGICRGMVEAMMKHGANAAIVGRKLERLTLTASELSASTGRQCIPAQADVRSPEQLRTAVDTTISKFGRIDFVICEVLFTGAAGNFLAPIENINEKGFRTVIEIDTLGTYHTVKATLPYVREQHGSYIMVSATYHYRGMAWQAHMSAAKAGVDALSRVLAVEEGPRGVRSNVIAPGPISGTEGMDRLGAKISDKDKKALGLMVTSDIPLQRTGHIGDIANATIFLFSNAASWITGQTLAVDGGSLHTDGYLLPYPTGILDPGSWERAALDNDANPTYNLPPMKDLILDANFPRTSSGRVYHLGLKHGEIANRIVTVGDPKRARTIAASFDTSPKPFELLSERGFLTITGMIHFLDNASYTFLIACRYDSRECLTGDMIIVRYGSCGALADVPVGSLVIPDACVAITRNWDFDFGGDSDPEKDKDAYIVSKPVSGDRELHAKLVEVINQAAASRSEQILVLGDVVNAAADSFYSSQGRQTSFPDHNASLIERLIDEIPRLTTLEMETFHLYHLAKSYTKLTKRLQNLSAGSMEVSMLHRGAIRASGVQMVFASRPTQEFITPDEVQNLERWVGQACLEALTQFEIAEELLHPNEGSVWE